MHKNIDDEDLKNYNCISLDTEWVKNYKVKNANGSMKIKLNMK